MQFVFVSIYISCTWRETSISLRIEPLGTPQITAPQGDDEFPGPTAVQISWEPSASTFFVKLKRDSKLYERSPSEEGDNLCYKEQRL